MQEQTFCRWPHRRRRRGPVADRHRQDRGLLISIFQMFLEQRSVDDCIALIVAPPPELTDQIEDDARLLGKHLDIPIASSYGGLGYAKQERALQEGARAAIGTTDARWTSPSSARRTPTPTAAGAACGPAPTAP